MLLVVLDRFGAPSVVSYSPVSSRPAYGVKSNDPITLAAVSCLLLVAGSATTLLPADDNASRSDGRTSFRVKGLSLRRSPTNGLRSLFRKERVEREVG